MNFDMDVNHVTYKSYTYFFWLDVHIIVPQWASLCPNHTDVASIGMIDAQFWPVVVYLYEA